MRIVIQRVLEASVTVEGRMISQIGPGLLVLAGFEETDTPEIIERMSTKLTNLRIFSDAAGLMNLSIKDVSGDIIIVSQFTLYASTKKGNRPSFTQAAKPDVANPLYESLVKRVELSLGRPVGTGVFGAEMKVSLINDGPVTICMDESFDDRG